MRDENILCPQCGYEFPLSEALKHQLEESIRTEFEAKFKNKKARLEEQVRRATEAELSPTINDLQVQLESTRAKLSEAQAVELDLRKKQRELDESKAALELEVARRVDQELERLKDEQEIKELLLAARESELEESKAQLETTVAERLQCERENIKKEALIQAETSLSLELGDLRDQNEKLSAGLKTAQKMELELRQSKRELEGKAESLELDVARRVDEERTKIRDDAIKQTQEEHRLNEREKEAQLEALRKQIEALKRKAEQGSQQLQGEVFELELEDVLKAEFPYDEIEPVPKGKRGADVLQKIHTTSGQQCGAIIWESKRTKSWGTDWIGKLKDDQRSAKAEIAVLVSTVLPKEVIHLAYQDGVWITDFSTTLGVATVLRSSLIEIFKARQALVGKSQKMDLLYDYISGPEFRQRVEALVETFKGMRQDLEQEKIAFQKNWAKRDKQIQRLLENTVIIYGDMQGLIGASLPEIKGLEPPHVELEEEIPF